MQPGAELIFTMLDGTRHVYTLDRTQVVDDDDVYIVDQTYGYRATLFGCHPKGSARQRMVGHFTLQSTTPAPASDRSRTPTTRRRVPSDRVVRSGHALGELPRERRRVCRTSRASSHDARRVPRRHIASLLVT